MKIIVGEMKIVIADCEVPCTPRAEFKILYFKQLRATRNLIKEENNKSGLFLQHTKPPAL